MSVRIGYIEHQVDSHNRRIHSMNDGLSGREPCFALMGMTSPWVDKALDYDDYFQEQIRHIALKNANEVVPWTLELYREWWEKNAPNSCFPKADKYASAKEWFDIAREYLKEAAASGKDLWVSI